MKIGEWITNHPARSASLAGWFQQSAGILAAVISIPFILNRLSAQESGLWFGFQGFLVAVALTDFGFSYVIARQVAHSLALREGRAEEESSDFIHTEPGWAGVSAIYRASRSLFFRVNSVGLALLILVHEVIMPFTKLAAAQSVDSTVAWYLLGASTLVTLQTRLHQSVLEGLGMMYVAKAVSGAFQLLTGFSIVAVLVVCARLAAASAAVFGLAVAQYLVFRWAVHQQARGQLAGGRRADAAIVRRLWRVAVPIGFVNSSAYCVTSIHVPLIGAVLGAEAVSPYYLAQRIGMAFTQAAMQLMQPQLPLFTREYSRGDQAAARRRMISTIGLVTLVVVAGCTAYFLASPTVVKMWVGPGKYISTSVLLMMSLNYAVMTSSAVPGFFVLASGRNPFLWSTLANGVLNLVLASVFCSWWGLAGLPLANLVSGLCTNYWYGPVQGLRLEHSLKSRLQ